MEIVHNVVIVRRESGSRRQAGAAGEIGADNTVRTLAAGLRHLYAAQRALRDVAKEVVGF